MKPVINSSRRFQHGASAHNITDSLFPCLVDSCRHLATSVDMKTPFVDSGSTHGMQALNEFYEQLIKN